PCDATRDRARDRPGDTFGRGRHPRGRAAARRRGRCGRTTDLRRPWARVDSRGRLPRGGQGRDEGSNVAVVAWVGCRRAGRRRVFAVVLVLTVAFLVLFWLANHYVFADLANIQPPPDVFVDTRTFAGSFLVGLAMFATLFLGVVLAVFLTLGVVTGDAER